LNTKKLRRDWLKNDNVYVGKLSGADDWIKNLKEKYHEEKSDILWEYISDKDVPEIQKRLEELEK